MVFAFLIMNIEIGGRREPKEEMYIEKTERREKKGDRYSSRLRKSR